MNGQTRRTPFSWLTANTRRLFILASCFMLHNTAIALEDNARVPVLLYHTSWAGSCDASSNDVLALERDLQLLHDNGWYSVPAYWLYQWSAGLRDGKSLPAQVVGITIDDGYDADWLNNLIPDHECAPLKSARQVVEAFAERNKSELPGYSPHVSLFVIASKEARKRIDAEHMNDNWWGEAHSHPHFSIYSHGTDHDFLKIQEPVWDDAMQVMLPTASFDDGVFQGQMQPDRHVSYTSNSNYIAKAAWYISSKTGSWPKMLAYPMGRYSDYTLNTYLPEYVHEHATEAAFCTTGKEERYLRKGSNPYCIPRLTYKHNFTSAEELLKLLDEARQK